MRSTQPINNTSFQDAVFAVVRNIPRGCILTYAQVAQRAGFPRAHRAVGSLLKKNYNPKIPCHRVIRSDGSLGEYNGGKDKKYALLKAEGAIT